MYLFAILKIFLDEASVHVLFPFVTEFLIIELKGFKFWLQVLCWTCDLKIFSSHPSLVFFTLLTVIWQSKVFNKHHFFFLLWMVLSFSLLTLGLTSDHKDDHFVWSTVDREDTSDTQCLSRKFSQPGLKSTNWS